MLAAPLCWTRSATTGTLLLDSPSRRVANTMRIIFLLHRTKMRWQETQIWYDNEMRWIRITVWNVGHYFILPNKIEQINDLLFKDTYKSNKIIIGANEMTVNTSEMSVRWETKLGQLLCTIHLILLLLLLFFCPWYSVTKDGEIKQSKLINYYYYYILHILG